MKMFYTSLNVLVPLLVGATVYLGYRPTCLLMFEWADYLHLTTYVDMLREYCASLNHTPSRFTLYCVPDGVWVHSMTATYLSIWNGEYKRGLFWVLTGVLLGVGSELGQLFGVVPGVFDLYDVVAYISFFTLGTCTQLIINGK